MIPFFPKQIANRAIFTYLVALVVISLFYYNYAMKLGYMALGLIFVSVFFFLTCFWSKNKRKTDEKEFTKTVFLVAIFLRLLWVIASYFYYIEFTGIPFARSKASKGLAKYPQLSSTTSLMPVQRNAVTGVPQDIASDATCPKTSV